MDQPTKRGRGRPRKPTRAATTAATGNPWAPIAPLIDTGAEELRARLADLSKAGETAAMDDAFHAWFLEIVKRANQDGPEGDDFTVYLQTLLTVMTDNDPNLSDEARALIPLFYRVFSARRDARAWAKHFGELLDQRRARGRLPLSPALIELSELATRHAQGRGGGTDSDIDHKPARDGALLRAYEAGMTQTELLTTSGLAHALNTYWSGFGKTPPDFRPSEEDTFHNAPALHKVLKGASRRRDVVRQCIDEMNALSCHLPFLSQS